MNSSPQSSMAVVVIRAFSNLWEQSFWIILKSQNYFSNLLKSQVGSDPYCKPFTCNLTQLANSASETILWLVLEVFPAEELLGLGGGEWTVLGKADTVQPALGQHDVD